MIKIFNKDELSCPIMERKAKLLKLRMAKIERDQPISVRIAILKEKLLKAKLGNNYESYKQLSTKLAKLRFAAGNFEENDHPRDGGGQFTCKDCGKSGPKSEEADHMSTHEEEKPNTNKKEKQPPKSMTKTKGLDSEKKKFSDPDRPYSTGLTGKQIKSVEKHLGTKVTDAFHGDSRGSVYAMQDGSEYLIYPDSRQAKRATFDYVKSQLEDEPESFSPDFIQQHIDIDTLRDNLKSDVHEMVSDSIRDDPESYGLSEEDTKGGPSGRDWTKMEQVAGKIADDDLADPVAYLQDAYGEEDGIKKAIEIGGIDTDSAARDAISTDGAGHFMSGYDGEEVELDDGTIMYRVN